MHSIVLAFSVARCARRFTLMPYLAAMTSYVALVGPRFLIVKNAVDSFIDFLAEFPFWHAQGPIDMPRDFGFLKHLSIGKPSLCGRGRCREGAVTMLGIRWSAS